MINDKIKFMIEKGILQETLIPNQYILYYYDALKYIKEHDLLTIIIQLKKQGYIKDYKYERKIKTINGNRLVKHMPYYIIEL